MIDRLRHMVLQAPDAALAALRRLPDRKGLAFVLAIVIAFLQLSVLLHMPHGPQHWTADIITALGSKRPATQHEKIAIVYVSEETLKPYAYLSPTDRGLLADLLKAVDAAEPDVIGWDFVIDRKTEPAKDDALKAAMIGTKARLVLGSVHTSDPDGANYQHDFLRDTGRAVGHLHFDEHHNPFLISDHVVRHMSKDHGHTLEAKRFASVLARQAEVTFEPRSHYISWLLSPADGSEQFLTLSAEQVLGRAGSALPIGDLLRGRIVLVGGNYSDRDQHLTPLSVLSHQQRYPGLFIHAQTLAQLLEGRQLHEVGTAGRVLLVVAAFGFGFWVGRISKALPLIVELASVAALVLAAGAAFIWLSFILPYNAIAIAWLAGAAAGHYSKPAHAHG